MATRTFVYIRSDGNQIFFRGNNLILKSPDTSNNQVIEVENEDSESVGFLVLRPGESIGLYFNDREKEKDKPKQ